MYALNWITDHLATGHAPMSYEELDSIREQGITAIVNLCGEFCDLHQVEESTGFEVYFLPIPDEDAPDLAAMDKALDWLDEALYCHKKVLVHCRLGHGRTGTFIAAYLLRRGFDLKLAQKTMKGRRANPATYQQHRFLKQYGKQVGPLRTATPRIDNRPALDISPLLLAYEQLIARFDRQTGRGEQERRCARADSGCCHLPLDLLLIESIHLSRTINKTLNQQQRRKVIERAVTLAQRLKDLRYHPPGAPIAAGAASSPHGSLVCPLLEDGECLVAADRPSPCRYGGLLATKEQEQEISRAIAEISQKTYLSLTGRMPPGEDLRFSLADTISGKFVQRYFQAMAEKKR